MRPVKSGKELIQSRRVTGESGSTLTLDDSLARNQFIGDAISCGENKLVLIVFPHPLGGETRE